MDMRICLKSIFWNQISSADQGVMKGTAMRTAPGLREEMLSDPSRVPQSGSLEMSMGGSMCKHNSGYHTRPPEPINLSSEIPIPSRCSEAHGCMCPAGTWESGQEKH
jgi:hypothetical protein